MNYSLSVNTRTVSGKKTRILRDKGLIPCVIYGHGENNRLISVKRVPFEKLFGSAGESSLIDLDIDSTDKVKVLIHEIQRQPITGQIIHVDFYQVKMSEKLTADIPLRFVGESRAVKELGGVLVKTLDHVKVECLPQDLAHEVTVDLSALNTFDDTIHVGDLSLPFGIKVLTRGEEAIVKVQPPRTEEELKAELAETAEVTPEEVPVVGKETKKEEEKEGETKAAAPASSGEQKKEK